MCLLSNVVQIYNKGKHEFTYTNYQFAHYMPNIYVYVKPVRNSIRDSTWATVTMSS